MSKVLLSQTKMQRMKAALARQDKNYRTEHISSFIMDHLTLSILNAILKKIFWKGTDSFPSAACYTSKSKWF